MSNNKFILKTSEEAKEFFGVTNNSKSGKFINYIYKIAKDNNLPMPIVAKYMASRGFAFRRWVKTRNDIILYIIKNNISFDNIFNNYKFKGFHDTTLEKIDNFPNASDFENLIGISLNLKSTFANNANKAVMYVLFGEVDNYKMTKDEEKKYNKYIKYYQDNKMYVDSLANNYDIQPGELFRKCSNKEVAQDINKDWVFLGNFNKKPNTTPKTDLISNLGSKLSVKKACGAQAMSGAMEESAATLNIYKNLLSKTYKKDVDSLFSRVWNPNDNTHIQFLDDTIKNIMSDSNNNKFILAVITEAITGVGKFGQKSNAVPNKIISWTNDSIIIDDLETYIFRVFQQFNRKSITINHKSSSNTWVCMRIYLPKHNEAYKPLTIEEKRKHKELLDIIKIICGNK